MYKEKDKGKALCECVGIVTTTFLYRDVHFSDGNGVINILVGVCDECSSVVSIPSQSTPKIKEALTELRK